MVSDERRKTMPFDEILNDLTDRSLKAAADEVFSRNKGNGEEKSLAMVYSPYQSWEDIFTEEEALKNGTLFARLYKPYTGGMRPR